MTATAAEVRAKQEGEGGTNQIDLTREAAARLAAIHRQTEHGAGRPLPLLAEHARWDAALSRARHTYAAAADENEVVSYAGEWLLDNFYIVKQAMRQVAEDLPTRFYREFPKLSTPPLAQLPRVYAVAREIADLSAEPHTMHQIRAFVTSYQITEPLTMGELWALPAMLRLVNLESLIWTVGRLTGDLASEAVRPGAVEGAAEEHRVATAIINLRMLAAQDWKVYFEAVSRVDQALRRDPADVYRQMDFPTRNRYRRTIERLAGGSARREEAAADAVLELAARRAGDPRAGHIGCYLLGDGRPELAEKIGAAAGWGWLVTLRRTRAPELYLIFVALLTMTIMLPLGLYTSAAGANAAQTVLMALLTLLPAAGAAINIVNWLISRAIPPDFLPKLDFARGVPDDCRTLVVVPAMLTDPDEIDSLVQQLEQHYLRNRDPNIWFALVVDYLDAPQQELPVDAALSTHIRDAVVSLNDRYVADGRRPFWLFVRGRRWNASENTWMGWERKRGKLTELNAKILDPTVQTSFSIMDIDPGELSRVRYVITLDADTVLPQDAGRRLIGTMAHPLNRPVFDQHGSVTAGYTILQPRVEIIASSGNRTHFSQIFAGDSGFDPYTLAASDVYQDWTGEGIYTGKGIYEVAGFEHSLADRTPENAILSHDLFEGIHGRAGLVSDIVMLEDYPSHYLIHARRLHRWTRGDWQLLPWLRTRVPMAAGRRAPTPLSLLDRWKLLDNLRRSLTQPALLALFVAGWLILPGAPTLWTVFGLLASAAPFFTGAADLLLRGRLNSWPLLAAQLRGGALRWWLSLVFLPYEAFLAADAIVHTLYRLRVRRYLLRWTTAARAGRAIRDRSLAATGQQMIVTVIFAAIVGAAVALVRPEALLIALPLLALWLTAPLIAHILSRPIREPVPDITPAQQAELRVLARQTWLFFEQFVSPESHWLPPDHYQEHPRGIVANQTSPTNIGLLLLSTMGAYDFGYLGAMDVSARLALTMESIERLERYRGHLLNWYDTRSLAPLPPSYVSTVDSGNLACCLLALRHALDEMPDKSLLRPQRWDGLRDILTLLSDSLDGLTSVGTASAAAELQEHITQIHGLIAAARGDAMDRARLLGRMTGELWPAIMRVLVEMLERERDSMTVEQFGALWLYADRVGNQLSHMLRDTNNLLPWLPLLAEPPPLFSSASLDPAVREAWDQLTFTLPPVPRIREVSRVCREAQRQVTRLQSTLSAQAASADVQAAIVWCTRLAETLTEAGAAGDGLLQSFAELQRRIDALLDEMDFEFLFDPQRKLFHIGYNVDTQRHDANYYDLLASEARLASLFSIASGEIPTEHWMYLGRPQTVIGGDTALLSWSGTMFEYLMPMLLTRTTAGTLLDASYESAVGAQIEYGRQHRVPWGISESGYYAFDGAQNYQYRAFGVPSLAFKRGLAADLVIAPYASLIALAVAPQAVMSNLKALAAAGALGRYGLYEAIDYTATRLQLGQEKAIVREYMAHHQGMIMLSLCNVLLGNRMIERFHADPRIESVELLLQEQIPRMIEPEFPSLDTSEAMPDGAPALNAEPWTVEGRASSPRVHYLSNGRYGVMVTAAGSGYSQWNAHALTRWQPDATLDDWGSWLYVRDQETGELWSAAHQPTKAPADTQTVTFFPHKAQYQRRDSDIALEMEIVVPPDDDLEIRRVRVTNRSDRPRRLLLTSYAEVVLSSQDADRRHPAFNKLFVESEHLPQFHALLFRRRPRSADEPGLFALHMLVAQQEGETLFEADRATFLGRNGTAARPQALAGGGLTGATGATLDPVMALGRELTLAPHESAQLAFITAAADSRGGVTALARTYQTWTTVEWAFEQARYRSERELRQLEIGSPDIRVFDRLLSALLYPHRSLRAAPAVLASNTKAQPGLWAHGISGDYPIILARIGDETEIGLVRDLVRAHRYWRNRQLKVTLVVLNERDTGYTQELYNQVHRLIVRMGSETWINRHDGIFLLRADLLNDPDRALLAASARVMLDAGRGGLEEQFSAADRTPVYLPALAAAIPAAADQMPPVPRPDDLQFDNGVGGFSPDGREYVIYRDEGRIPPAPWTNVIANAAFGFTVTEAGGGYTWAGNSSENRLTAWRNDPVTDMPAEAIYLRDEETTQVWSPTPLPAGDGSAYLIRHGWGYTSFEHHSREIKQHITMFAAADQPVKIIRVRLENTSARARRVTATYYAEWVLGTVRGITQQYIVPEFDSTARTLLFRNPYSIDFGGSYAFVTAGKDFHGLTTDRAEFLGRLGDYRRPAALERVGLSGAVQAGADPCAAVMLHVDLPAGGIDEVYFVIGAGESREAALQTSRAFREAAQVESAWDGVTRFWEQTLTQTTARTPDPALNTILPWLLYQALSCRIWGRSALYQSGGAFGFRDQLQDVTALIHAHPRLAREHILRAARHQFEAGDVLHWWHPPNSRGVRTRFADDLVWLPYVTAHYVASTGDAAVLDERMPFLKGEPLKPDEDERYGTWEIGTEAHTLYEHCKRALNKAATQGAHGLPLMGSGDWNDGMNRVGVHGRGESVWMGWFMITALTAFAPLCDARGEDKQAALYLQKAEDYRQALEANAWDGQWYLRAYYDDGTPLGSAQNIECRIDSLSQSWAVISNAAEPARAQQAMESVMARLIDRSVQILKLFEPPFDKTERDPGYIKGYVPGIRENGGQYTHAAIWSAWAFAELGDGDRAGALFRLLNPISHGDAAGQIETYKVEPYVIAADVYSVTPHEGRGGWTWYTGSSGWMYRLGVEAILGLKRDAGGLRIDPCIPQEWHGFDMTYRAGGTTYRIRVENPNGVCRGIASITLDGAPVPDGRIPLTAAGGETRSVVVTMG